MKIRSLFKAGGFVSIISALLLSVASGQVTTFNGKATTKGSGKFNMTLNGISRDFSADLIVPQIKNVRAVPQWKSKSDIGKVMTANSNTQGLVWWSGIKNPMSTNVNFSVTGKISTEFYIVTQWSPGFIKLIGSTGGKFVGNIAVGGKTYPVYRTGKTVTSKDKNGKPYKHFGLWVLAGGANPVNATPIMGAVFQKGWVAKNEYIQWWFRFIEVYNTGPVINKEVRLWFK